MRDTDSNIGTDTGCTHWTWMRIRIRDTDADADADTGYGIRIRIRIRTRDTGYGVRVLMWIETRNTEYGNNEFTQFCLNLMHQKEGRKTDVVLTGGVHPRKVPFMVVVLVASGVRAISRRGQLILRWYSPIPAWQCCNGVA
jgi:hypothetical protein